MTATNSWCPSKHDFEQMLHEKSECKVSCHTNDAKNSHKIFCLDFVGLGRQPEKFHIDSRLSTYK